MRSSSSYRLILRGCIRGAALPAGGDAVSGSGGSLRSGVRGVLLVLDVEAELAAIRHVDEGHPTAALARALVVVPVLYPVFLDRQQQQVAGLPLDDLVVDLAVALALDDVDDQAPLVAVLAV